MKQYDNKIFTMPNNITINCYSVDNRTGWKHVAILFNNNIEVCRTTIQYYNRTWEKYLYETIQQKVFETYEKQKILYRNK